MHNATAPPVLGVEALRTGYATNTLRVLDVVDDVLARLAARGNDAVWIRTTPAEALHARAAVPAGPIPTTPGPGPRGIRPPDRPLVTPSRPTEEVP